MKKGLIKTFQKGPSPADVLTHLERCQACLSRVSALIWGIPAGGPPRPALAMRRCLRADRASDDGPNEPTARQLPLF